MSREDDPSSAIGRGWASTYSATTQGILAYLLQSIYLFLSQTGYFAVGLNYRSSESSKSRVRLEGTFCAFILLLYSLHDIPRRG
jgi:hypothetical protein